MEPCINWHDELSYCRQLSKHPIDVAKNIVSPEIAQRYVLSRVAAAATAKEELVAIELAIVARRIKKEFCHR